ncbi:hypothetical protein XELAEV_18037106mg [Xenopus laevis]|uniref:Uncharacterized protein n=1 Tax=Xenopus laevis TaxID=8355 RepID=A0A974CCS5_XENLA|nr:hypothetical protein XELAEV_18037106mg [Xenopus laevis]
MRGARVLKGPNCCRDPRRPFPAVATARHRWSLAAATTGGWGQGIGSKQPGERDTGEGKCGKADHVLRALVSM